MPASTSFVSDAGSLGSAVIKTERPTGRFSGSTALSPRDITAICRYLNLPTPTPDVNFDRVIEMSGLTAEDVYVRLERSTDINVMIAASIIRSGVTVLKDDQRLKPAPHAKAEKTPRKERSAPPRSTSSSDDIPGEAVISEIGECTSKEGSSRAARFAIYTKGMTVVDALAKGLRLKDLRRNVADGSITITLP